VAARLKKFSLFFFFTGSTAPLDPASAFQFHDHFTDGRTLLTSDQLVARPLPKHRTSQTQIKHVHETFMRCVGFEPTIPASERAMAVHALDRSATVTGFSLFTDTKIRIPCSYVSSTEPYLEPAGPNPFRHIRAHEDPDHYLGIVTTQRDV
jgi:hypothetical protein